MRKFLFVFVGLVALSLSSAPFSDAVKLKNVVGTYDLKIKTKVWLQGEGTDTSNTTGTCVLNKKKKFQVNESVGYTYRGKFKIKGKKLKVKKTKKLRNAIENQALENWLKGYVASQGDSLTNLSFNYTQYKISNVKIKKGKPKKLTIKLQGRASGTINGSERVTRQFKYQSVMKFR
jgi:hypothetical protein